MPSKQPKINILVAGGAGFIGSHLCERLLEEGYRVVCLDNLLTGARKNIKAFDSNPNFHFIESDVTEKLSINNLPAGKAGYQLSIIINLACPASPKQYTQYPIETLQASSLGTENLLKLARQNRTRFVHASTSEVYGDPLKHPQKESYWGNVNTYGPRAMYDEGKRYAEALIYNYRRLYKLSTGIVRIFNSILADQPVFVFNDKQFHRDTIEQYVEKLEKDLTSKQKEIYVPAFDPQDHTVKLRKVSAVIKQPCVSDTYELSLRYGRKVKTTGHHSVFTRGRLGEPVAKPVSTLQASDYVAIPARVPVFEKNLREINITKELIDRLDNSELWGYSLHSPELKDEIALRRKEVNKIIEQSGHYSSRRYRDGIVCASNRFRRNSFLPLAIVKQLNLKIPTQAQVRVFSGGAHVYTPNKIKITNEILWLFGFFVAEGSSHWEKGKSYFINFSSDILFLKKAKRILEDNFGVRAIYQPPNHQRSPSLFIHSKILFIILDKIFNLIGNRQLPSWIIQLPLSKLKYFLEGYKDGDGTHSGKKVSNELVFDTTSQHLSFDLNFILLRFGIVASLGSYHTRFKQKYGNKKFPFYRLTICKLNDFNILNWDKGVRQTLNAMRIGDLVWAKIKKIKKCRPTNYVYDFSVPGFENFIAGNGVCCHNTYGPKMQLDDGRVVSNFIVQALQDKPITVYGDGRQSRSFCYVDDIIEGLVRMIKSEVEGPINLGNPQEFTVNDLAQKILALTQSQSKIQYEPLPQDDPQQRRPDITRAKIELGWEPKVDLEQGLKLTIEWFKQQMTDY